MFDSKIIEKSIGYKSLGTSSFNIYDYQFSFKILVNDNVFPLFTEIKYFYNYPISKKKEKQYLTVIGKNNEKEIIEIRKGDIIGYIINVKNKNDCKEKNIVFEKKKFKISSFDLPKNNEIISYNRISSNTSICICLKKNKFYLYSIENKIDKKDIENIYLPYIGENTINPLFKIYNWETEIIINNNCKYNCVLDKNEYFSNACYHNKENFLYFSIPKTCIIKNNYNIKYKIYFTFNNQKYLIKNKYFIFDSRHKKNHYVKNGNDYFDVILIDKDLYNLNFGVIKIKTLGLLKQILV